MLKTMLKSFEFLKKIKRKETLCCIALSGLSRKFSGGIVTSS